MITVAQEFVVLTQAEVVEHFKSSAFDIKKKENPKNWPRVKEILTESHIKNDRQLTEESKNELIEFINNLEKEDK
jgi:hypothetical protein